MVAVVRDGGGRQAMKVSLSESVRQDCCMAYSSGRVSGSLAVRAWRSFVVLDLLSGGGYCLLGGNAVRA